MKKTDPRNAPKPPRPDAIELRKKREFVQSLRGKFHGKDLLKELMAEKAERKL